jgi:hypothetical protein
VLLHGLDTNQSGLSAGANYFAAPVSGTIGTATTSRSVGKARNTTSNGGAGILYSAGTFTGGARAVISGDTLNVTYTASV